MARLNKENEARAREIMGRYPQVRSAMIPLLHLVQEQDGYVTRDGMVHVAELLELTPAEVYGTATFYEMFKLEPVGRYLVNVCTNISCMLLGGYELLDAFEAKLGVKPGSTTPDGLFTLEEVECVAACTQAPCALVNYRVFGDLTTESAGGLIDDLRAGRLSDTVPQHGVTNRVALPQLATIGGGPAPAPEEDAASGPGPAKGAEQERSKEPTSPTREPESGGA